MAAESSFFLPNLGFVWARETGSLEFPTLNYGISFTRLANFNETIAYDGRSSRSIIDAVTEDFIDLENVFDDDAAAFRSALITQIDPTVGPTFIDPFFDTRPVRYDFLSTTPISMTLILMATTASSSSRKTMTRPYAVAVA